MALRLLGHDPCREDTHRLAMHCYVRVGARAQAVRQYEVCEHILARTRSPPEPSTENLYELIRLNPAAV
jgi:DNA-binding SARP family transcriptional activator